MRRRANKNATTLLGEVSSLIPQLELATLLSFCALSWKTIQFTFECYVMFLWDVASFCGWLHVNHALVFLWLSSLFLFRFRLWSRSTHSVFDVVVVVAVDLDRRLVTQPTCPTQHAHVDVTCAARIVQIQIESTLVFALLIKPQVSGRSTSITTLLPSHVVTPSFARGHSFLRVWSPPLLCLDILVCCCCL